MPAYFRSSGIQRTRYKSAGFSQKKIDGIFKKGFYDGAFNGWPGEWSLPAAPATVCYFPSREEQEFSLHIYTVAFFLGSVEAIPGVEAPDPADGDIHQQIAQVGVFLLLEG